MSALFEDVRSFLEEVAERDCSHSLALAWGDQRTCKDFMSYPQDWCEGCKAVGLLRRWHEEAA